MFKLALALGKDVREIEAMPSRLISEWLAYDALDLLPDHYWIGAQICAVTMAAAGANPSRVSDYIPRVRTARCPLSGEAGMAMMQGIIAQQKAQEAIANLMAGRGGQDIKVD